MQKREVDSDIKAKNKDIVTEKIIEVLNSSPVTSSVRPLSLNMEAALHFDKVLELIRNTLFKFR